MATGGASCCVTDARLQNVSLCMQKQLLTISKGSKALDSLCLPVIFACNQQWSTKLLEECSGKLNLNMAAR
ncbi:hypothetical protein AV530_013374 [Patagioenas fasciata monilis]|uniref:Uncharacterized protein n=1 Tax=Patagioenas fasciata monilis TaxID=372326 RepID=A0A1V4JPK6_PATFA|nr:hypothetical protein AV530_013374 [Patagioenas fasciata monilis]